MKTWLLRYPLAVLALCVVPALAEARGPRWHGLEAVAISPDGKTLVTGGQSRVLYVIDAEKLEVRQRLWVGARIGFVAFNRDGSRLLVEDDVPAVSLYDTATWKVVKSVSGVEFASVAVAADLVAVRKNPFGKSEIQFLSLADLGDKGKVEVDAGAAAFGLSPDGKTLAVLTRSKDTKDEKRLNFNEIPNDLKGIKRKEFVQRNDGRAAELLVFDVDAGKLVRTTKSWYTADYDTTVAYLNDTAYLLNYDNLGAKISKEGDITVFESPLFTNYALGLSPDSKTVVVGSAGEGSIGGFEGAKWQSFRIDRVRGWMEFFGSFAVGRDGTVYGVTSAFRLVKVSAGGKVEKVVPVY